MKKIILCLLLVAALTMAFAACGKKDDEQPNDSDPIESTPEESAPESVTLNGGAFANDNEVYYDNSWN